MANVRRRIAALFALGTGQSLTGPLTRARLSQLLGDEQKFRFDAKNAAAIKGFIRVATPRRTAQTLKKSA